MSFKRRQPPQVPSLPSQQPAPELMDVIDEISGVQTITVTGPDGRKRRMTQRLPLTPQEQQTLDQAKNLINKAVTNIETLYRYDPSSVVNYQPFIQAFSQINQERAADLAQIGDFKDIAERVEQFRTINNELSLREFDNRERALEENLARRGLQRSTQASEQRALMARERGLLAQQLDVNARSYGEDLASRQLQRESSVYGIREQGRQGRLQEAGTGYELERQRLADLEAVRQNAINENMNFLNVGSSVTGQDAERARLALAGNQGALSAFNSQAANQNQRFLNEAKRIQAQHEMSMGRFRETPASFGQQLTDVGLSLAGNVAGQYIGSRIPGIGSSSSSEGQPGRQRTFGQLSRLGSR
jgi:hypothetical protein